MEHIVFVHDLFRVLVPAGSEWRQATGPGIERQAPSTRGLVEMLTRKQYELLRFINERLKEAGVPPSFDEMKDALDLRSKSGIHRLITALEERGFIRRLPNRARAIEVIKLPETAAAAAATAAAASRPASSKAISARSARSGGGSENDAERPVAVPVMGRIAAGTPIEALQTRSHTISVPPDMLGSGEHYALEVRGDSMVEAGILDGDMALIQRNETAETGDIVVALIDEEEATLKRFRRRGASIALEPANASYEVRILPPNRVQIQGKLIGLYRQVLKHFEQSHVLGLAPTWIPVSERRVKSKSGSNSGQAAIAGGPSQSSAGRSAAARRRVDRARQLRSVVTVRRPSIADRRRPGPVDAVGPDGIDGKFVCAT